MAILDRLQSPPRRLAAPAVAAAGLAAGFYPRPVPTSAVLAAACALAGLGLALRGLSQTSPCPGPEGPARRRQVGPRAWACLPLAAALGLAAGGALARDDQARGLFAASPLFSTAGDGNDAAPQPGRAGPAAALPALALAGIEGRLGADSSSVRGGLRSYMVRVSRIALAVCAASGGLEFPGGPPGEMRVLARGGPPLDAGALVSAAGSPGRGVLFARPAGISVRDRGGRPARWRSSARAAVRAALARVGGRSAGLLEALLLGARDGLEAEVAEAFKAAGCAHVLALSGQHLAVVAVLVTAALKPLRGPIRAGKAAAIAIAAFVWLAGPSPSLLRAALMSWIGAAVAALDRPQGRLDLLGLCLLAALPADPAAARSLGFVLSYLAVWGIAVLAPRFRFLLEPILPPAISGAAAASLGAQAATAPVLAFAFGSLQPMGILASMLSAPLVAAFMWWGMGAAAACAALRAVLPAGAAAAAASAAARGSDLLYDLLVGVMRAAASVSPIALPDMEARCAASSVVALLAAWVYAYPWIAHRRHRSRSVGEPLPHLRMRKCGRP